MDGLKASERVTYGSVDAVQIMLGREGPENA